MKFEWDINKAAENIKNHGVGFDEAIEAFYDPKAVYGADKEHSEAEERFYVIGFSSRRLLFVIYAERVESDTIRFYHGAKSGSEIPERIPGRQLWNRMKSSRFGSALLGKMKKAA